MEVIPEARLSKIEGRLSKLEEGKKDRWDKFQIIATLLIPASITWVGYYYSEAMKKAEIESSQHIAEQQDETAKISARVGQAQLVSSFMDALLSHDTQKQRLAIEAILIALPVEGPRLVAVVSQSSPNPEVRTFAENSLDQRRSQLIRSAFSDQKAVRIAATQDLVQGWRSDKDVVPQVLQAASQNPTNQDGIVNALVVLENVDKSSLTANAQKVNEFLNRVERTGPVTREHVKRVRDRLNSADTR
jgi:hypothetical protein